MIYLHLKVLLWLLSGKSKGKKQGVGRINQDTLATTQERNGNLD
jgi:hypothetical protein